MPSGGRQRVFGDLCKDCKISLDQYNSVFKLFRLQARCKECFKIHHDSIPSRSKEARKEQYVNWKWGLSINEYNKKSELQSHACAICKQICSTGRKLAIDHNHKTNVIRDLLCHNCNIALGLLNEDETIIQNMLDYLKKHNVKTA